MNESEFQKIAEQTIEDIQDAIDNTEADIDYDEIGGVLTLEFENGSKIIFSKQGAMNQLWVAAVSGGFHFYYNENKNQWLCDDGDNEELYAMLSRLATEQAGETVLLKTAS
ncbi:Frataxin homolog CyaY, facilitates iron supply for heme A synthesis or Fe-S cluster assembly [hydrothermal vent metagenome]|uniref:Frataxin homolog CyaY, facilitates iron supply for heme A synthesis or Fe-S cluster assembly n=1 Tax=hydrothermal vent metagenome TaxID=652676 RepID=A0A3B0WCR3_9ZZZZ